MQIWKSTNIFVFIWKYVEDFTLKNTFLLFDTCARKTCEKLVYKHSETMEYDKKLAYFFTNLQTSWANYLRVLWIKKAKFSGYCFYMNTNLKRDFQICISVPLRTAFLLEHLWWLLLDVGKHHSVKSVQIRRFFGPFFSFIRTKYRDLLCEFLYSVWVQENVDQKKPEIRTFFTQRTCRGFFGKISVLGKTFPWLEILQILKIAIL